MGDKQGPSSNHDQVGAGLGVPKAHPNSILIGGRAYSILIGGKTVHPPQRLKLFLLTSGKTQLQEWTKHSIVISTISEQRPILLLFELIINHN